MSSLDKAVRHSVPKPSALVLNYPANPTAVVADLDFYREVVGFAKKHELIVLSDLAYAEIYFDGEPPPSILQIPGADGYRGGVHHAVEDLRHAGLARRLRRRQ